MNTEEKLIERLCSCFGPVGREEAVADAIREELSGIPAEMTTDAMGNLTVHLPGPTDSPRIMLSAHTDEVGMIVTGITDEGYLRFDCLGGIDPCVLGGRPVTVMGKEKMIAGVISALGVHFLDREERKKVPKIKDLVIDIGTDNRAESEKIVALGACAVFDIQLMLFGRENAFVCGKALDDRMGCAALIEVIRKVAGANLPLDLYFCFTVREEIGISGARVTAQRIAPKAAFILETTAVADLPDVPPAKRVSALGDGGTLSLMDRATVYDRELTDFALSAARSHGIPIQIKRYVSGGNDAGSIQRSGMGVRCLALSVPTRYLHAPVSVAALCDYRAVRDLIFALLTDWEEKEN